MAILKIWKAIRQRGPHGALSKVMTVAPAYLSGIADWRVRRCQCCGRPTVFIAHHGGAGESRSCLLCSANERYELLAAEIRSRYGKRLSELDVLELDPHSPLGTALASARTYTRSFYEEGCTSRHKNGAVCEDITALTFRDNSLDLIVSSDVLEHVPQLDKAFSETARVLKPGGAHLFTVPPRSKTRKRAEIVDGQVRHIEPADYHKDPLSTQGILAFWDVGPDLTNVIPCAGLKVKIVRGPCGDEGRVVWIAERA
jgi:SAM-dependent methyltransferase